MKHINAFPIEDFIEKARLAMRTNQKNLSLTQKEYTDLAHSLALVMTRLTESLDRTIQEKPNNDLTVKMDGGKF